MDTLLEQLVTQLLGSGTNIVLTIGWVLYIAERFYLHQRREKQFREDMQKWRDDYHSMTVRTQEAMSRLTVLLEVIKDRTERPGHGGQQ